MKRLLIILPLCVMFIASCLKEGDETISLEYGDAQELVPGVWRVDACKNVTSSKSENLPLDSWIGTKLHCFAGGLFIEEQPGQEEDDDESVSAKYWSVSSESQFGDVFLVLGGNEYKVLSLGSSRMILSASGKQYDVNKISGTEETNPYDRFSDATRPVSTGQSAELGIKGLLMFLPKGIVPLNDKGEDGTIVFSMKKGGSCPYSLPSGTDRISDIFKVEPFGFIFQSPLRLRFDMLGHDPSEVTLMHYNENSDKWEMIPFSKIYGDGTAEVTTLDLGYFTLIKKNAENKSCGICFNGNGLQAGYCYYILIENCSDSSLNGKMTYSGGGNLYMPFLPAGSYKIRLVREQKASLNEKAVSTEYSSILNVELESPLIGKGTSFEKYSGWHTIDASDFEWTDGRPSGWDKPTVTYGTGKFQATLTWVNTSSASVDYDLHLVMPDGHVYFGDSRYPCFELDRDWLRQSGNAVENIYSTANNFTRGHYRVYVHHYSGDTGIKFNCRIIINGYTVVSQSSSLSSGSCDIYEFDVE